MGVPLPSEAGSLGWVPPAEGWGESAPPAASPSPPAPGGRGCPPPTRALPDSALDRSFLHPLRGLLENRSAGRPTACDLHLVRRSRDRVPHHRRGSASSAWPGPGQGRRLSGDLGGLDATRTLVIPDSRGTGDTAPAEDPGSYAFTGSRRTWRPCAALGWNASPCLHTDAAAAIAQAYAAADVRPAHPPRPGRTRLAAAGRAAGRRPGDLPGAGAEQWWPEAMVALHDLPGVHRLRRGQRRCC